MRTFGRSRGVLGEEPVRGWGRYYFTGFVGVEKQWRQASERVQRAQAANPAAPGVRLEYSHNQVKFFVVMQRFLRDWCSLFGGPAVFELEIQINRRFLPLVRQVYDLPFFRHVLATASQDNPTRQA